MLFVAQHPHMLTLLDLSAAFDTVDHGTLIWRLETSYGLRGRLLRWFSSFINGRTQSVRCGPGKSAPLFLWVECHKGQSSDRSFSSYTRRISYRWLNATHFYQTCMLTTPRSWDFCSPSRTASLQEAMSVCIDEVSQWMRSNRLQLNTTKTNILLCATSRRQHQIPQTPTRAGYDYVMTARSVWDLGIYLDADASMTTHVTKSALSCFAALRQIRAIRRSLTRPVLL